MDALEFQFSPWRSACLVVALLVVGIAGAGAANVAAQDDLPLDPIRSIHTPVDSLYVPVRVGDTVRVSGRVSATSGQVGPEERVFIQDRGYGIALDLPSADPSLRVGDRVQARGVIRHRNGLASIQVVDYTATEEASRPPEPLVTTADSLRRQRYEGLLVQVRGEVTRVGSNNGGEYLLVQSTPEGEPMAVFAENRHMSRLRLERFDVGDRIEVTGIAAQHDYTSPYTEYYEVLPRTEADVRQAFIPARYYRNVALIIGALIVLAVVVIVTLRQEVRRRTQEVDESQERFRRLAEATFEGILIHRDGEILDINQVLTDMTGYDRDDVVGQDARDFLTDATRDLVQDQLEHHREEPYEVVVVRKDGSTFPAEIEAKNVEGRDGTVRIAAIRDITKRKEDEAELLLAKEKAEQVARLKSSLLNNMSHELRTPITGIIGYAELIMDEPPETHDAFARHIRKSGMRLSDTLQSVLDMAQIEAGTLDLTVQETNVEGLARDVVDGHRPAADEKDVDLEVSCDGNPTLRTDRTLVYRILNNLVHNAVKFTPAGYVRVTLRSYSAGMHISVTDSGIGIDAEFRSRIFEPFQQESDGRTRHFEGTGLGLAITKHMVDLLGGQIRVDSAKGEGSTFWVDLPRREAKTDGESVPEDGVPRASVED